MIVDLVSYPLFFVADLDLLGIQLQLAALGRQSDHVCLQVVKCLPGELLKEMFDLAVLLLLVLQDLIVFFNSSGILKLFFFKPQHPNSLSMIGDIKGS